MINVRCIGRVKDTHRDVYVSYKLKNANGTVCTVETNALKEQIKNGAVVVTNLTLTSDNKLLTKRESYKAMEG